VGPNRFVTVINCTSDGDGIQNPRSGVSNREWFCLNRKQTAGQCAACLVRQDDRAITAIGPPPSGP